MAAPPNALAALILCFTASTAPTAAAPTVSAQDEADPEGNPWIHGWGSGSDMLWADFGSATLLTPEQLAFIGKTYSIVSLEKCTGQAQHLSTEAAYGILSAELKKVNPNVKVLFYWHATLEIASPDHPASACYDAGRTFLEHPDWWLRNDDGTRHIDGPFVYRNLSNPDVQRYMIDTPVGVQAKAPQNFDGVFYDGAIQSPYVNLSLSRVAAQNAAVNQIALAMSEALEAGEHATGGHQVIGNGFAQYHSGNPGFPADNGTGMVPWMDGICVEHFGAFEMINASNCSLIPEHMAAMMGDIAGAAALNKTVLIKGWPGPVNGPIDQFGPTIPPACKMGNGGETYADRGAMAARWFEPTYALFLLVADQTVFWSYSWWYNVKDGYYPSNPNSNSSAPAEWYPMLDSAVGAPLGDATRVAGGSGWVYRRAFEHADVEVDLADYIHGTVTFHSS